MSNQADSGQRRCRVGEAGCGRQILYTQLRFFARLRKKQETNVPLSYLSLSVV